LYPVTYIQLQLKWSSNSYHQTFNWNKC